MPTATATPRRTRASEHANAPMHTAQHLSAMVPVQRSDVNSPLLCSHRVAPQMIADDVLCELEAGCRRSPSLMERRHERSKSPEQTIHIAARALLDVTNSSLPPPPTKTVVGAAAAIAADAALAARAALAMHASPTARSASATSASSL